MFKYLILLSLSVTAGCNSTQPIAAPASKPNPYELNATEVAAVQAGLRGSVRDPNSLIFAGAKAAKHPNGVIEVCGLVNGKNGFGGYSGNVPYNGIVAVNDMGRTVFVVTGIGDTSASAQAIMMVCRRNGVI